MTVPDVAAPPSSRSGRPRLLVVETNAGGHRGEHLRWIAEGWLRRGAAGRLVILAPAALLEDHPELSEFGEAITAHPLHAPPDRGTQWESLFGTHRARPLADALTEHRPERALLMSFDHFLAPLAAHVPLPAGTSLGALTLRPTLHYDTIGSPAKGLRERAERAIKRAWTRRAVRHPALETLFTLDPTSIPALAALGGAGVVGVPDPVPDEPVLHTADAVRSDLGVEPGRRLLLLAGGLDRRKGPLAVLRAVPLLPPEAARRVAVVLWGRLHDDIRGDVRSLDREARASGAQVIVRDAFVPAGEMQTAVAAADVLLVPYLRHVGSSGLLMRAAGAGVPVLSQSWGAMGHLVRQHRLGQTTDPDEPVRLAAAIACAVADPRTDFDAREAAAFARGYTEEAYSDALLSHLAP